MENNNNKVTLVVEEKQFECKKTELIKNSDYFGVMFGGSFAEHNQDVIELKDVNAKGFEFVLKLCHCNENYNEPENCEDYLITAETADMLQFMKVLEIVIPKIIQLITIENVFKVLKFAEKNDYGMDLLARVRCFALTEFDKVKKSEDFLNLNIIELYKYLSDIHLWCQNEMQVFNAFIDWFNHHQNDEIYCNESTLYLLLSCLDFNSIENLNEICEHNTIKKYNEIVKILNDIINDEYMTNDRAKKLKDTKSRKRGQCFGLVSFDLGKKLIWYKNNDNNEISRYELKFITDNFKNSFDRGKNIFGYKHYICWTAYYSDEKPKNQLRMYNTITERVEKKHSRFFGAENYPNHLVCGSTVYFFSSSSKLMGYFDFKEDKWTTFTLLGFHENKIEADIRFFTHNNRLFATHSLSGILNICYYDGKWQNLIQNEHIKSKFYEQGYLLSFSKNNMIHCLNFLDGLLYIFEIKRHFAIRNKVISIEREMFFLEGLYNSGTVYYLKGNNEADACTNFEDFRRLFFKIHGQYELIALNTESCRKQCIDVMKLKPEIFNFRHYNVCEKQGFINNHANDILKCYIEKML